MVASQALGEITIITDWRYLDQDKAETKLTSPAAAQQGEDTADIPQVTIINTSLQPDIWTHLSVVSKLSLHIGLNGS